MSSKRHMIRANLLYIPLKKITFQVAQRKRKIKCPMCRLWIASKTWHNGKHREMCAKKNEYFIRQLPEPFDIRCPTCLKYLKLMPKVSFFLAAHIAERS